MGGPACCPVTLCAHPSWALLGATCSFAVAGCARRLLCQESDVSVIAAPKEVATCSADLLQGLEKVCPGTQPWRCPDNLLQLQNTASGLLPPGSPR